VAELSAFGSDFLFQGSRYKTIWSVIRGPVRKRRNYKQDWILCDMWAVDESGAQVDGGDVAIGSEPWTAAVEDTAFDAFISDRIRIGELGMFQFADDYKPELSYYDVQDQMFRFVELLERKPDMDIKFHEGLTLRWFETPEWSVFVDERGVPNGFEHAERGDECGGGLWFDGRVLVDYDGVFSLPAGVIALCEKLGFNMDYAKETADE
jgi:hypothetical protein